MKKAWLVLVLVVACGKEATAPKPQPVAKKSPSPLAPLPAQRGEGDYVEWVRGAPAFKFHITIGNESAEGQLTRARVGEERVQFKVKGDEWTATRSVKGVAWTRNGKPDTNEPAFADRVYQWMTLFPDPAKSKPEVVGTEGGETHLRFTNLNTNETNDVWIRSDNHLARLKTSGAGSAFPAVEITIE
ncbi:MAG TPA: hypothetical protein VII75_08815 [Thermoanaerobaculia bacterium]|nr:hypothetical protein [Thermoanaerobaculia bacterium]